MTPSELSTLTPNQSLVYYIEMEWEYSHNLTPRQIAIKKTGEFVKELEGKVLIRLSECCEVWVDIEKINVC